MFLQVLGVLFLLLICAAGFFVWRLYRLARKRSGSDLATAIAQLASDKAALDAQLTKIRKRRGLFGFLFKSSKARGVEDPKISASAPVTPRAGRTDGIGAHKPQLSAAHL